MSAILTDVIMANMTAGEVESSTGGLLMCGARGTAITGISIDSRTVRQGDLFIAIRGPKHDGHRFILPALSKGARGAVVQAPYEPPEGFPADGFLLRVDDTHQALKDLAMDVRRRWRGTLIGITGSMGKTTTKEFASQVLQTDYSVYRSPGNYNNLFGLPLAVFGLSPDDHIGIFEMGMSAPGEIAEMCRIARPNVGVLTNVAPVHLQFFNSLEDIARAKGELAEGLQLDGTLIYNADDPLVRQIAERFPGRKIGFGFTTPAAVRADDIEIVSLQETRFRLRAAGRDLRAAVPLAGAHYVLNALAAVTLGVHYRVGLDQIVESLRYLRPTQMRGQIVQFRAGFTVIDDSYNSNPRALTQMVDTLARIPNFKRRILIAGEMLELGRESAALHYRCGTHTAASGIDILVGVQGDAAEIVNAAKSGGMAESRAHFFTEVNPAIDYLCRVLQAGDLVLIKGSRGVHLEKMVQALRSGFPEQVH
jgi:UDP-N-acetylmuramoyl-tripeptide--D-alanyl-D-alanine ligase